MDKAFNPRNGIFPFRSDGTIQFFSNGSYTFKVLEECIDRATRYIFFQVYIFDDDSTGEHISKKLLQAAGRGVKVMILLDGFGSHTLPGSYIKSWKGAGIEFRFFSPLFVSGFFHVGIRLHHKIFVFDGREAMTGGINIADKYSGYHGKQHWLDFAVHLRGGIVSDLQRVCEQAWFRPFSGLRRKKMKSAEAPLFQPGNMRARVLQNEFARRRIGISTTYKQNLRKARHSVTIVSSYFLPSFTLIRLLKKAAKRGVKVRILLQGKADVALVKPATTYLYPLLLNQGIRLFEWEQSVLHGKLALFDTASVITGSYNLNKLSDFGSLECNVEVADNDFARSVQDIIDSIFNQCVEVDAGQYLKRVSFLQQLRNGFNYMLVKLSFRFLFFLQR